MSEKLQLIWSKFKSGLKYFYEEFIKFPAFILVHPLKGFDYFKRDKKANMKVAIGMIIATIIVQILQFLYSGFLVNNNNVKDLNGFAQVTYVVAPIVLIVLANWSITTLFDGKGKVIEIFMMISYSLFPLIFSGLFGIILSNILAIEEIALYNLVTGIGVFLMGYMVFFGMISIHEYGLGQVLLSIIGTIIALLVIIFILLLFFDLFQKIYGFIYTIYREVALRYL